jgi:uncharacterized membrane protein YuzA (DUF378 family)
MKAIDIVTLVIVIIGAINWGLVVLFDFNLVTAIFGDGGIAAGASGAAKAVYVIIALCGVWQLVPLLRMLMPSAGSRRMA